MFVSDADYILTELNTLMGDHGWLARWKPILVEDPSGCPAPSRFDETTSDNLIHHAYHVLTAEGLLGDIRDFGEIVEFGGGYGSFARLARRLGSVARYHIHDLPEFIALQRYYLASVAAQRGDPTVRENMTWGSSIEDLPERTASRRLFVGLWSLSEMPVRDREPWLDIIAKCDGVLIGFQGEFEGADNRSWFDIVQRQARLNWVCWEIPHLKGNYYLVGRRG